MPSTSGELRLQAADDIRAALVRSSSGFRLIWMRPLFSVVLVPSTPMKEERLSTAGSFRITSAKLLLALRHAANETVLRRFRDAQNDPGILDGKKPLGTTM